MTEETLPEFAGVSCGASAEVPLEYFPATYVLALFRNGELSPSEYLEVLFDRLEEDRRQDEPVNAFCEILYDEARELARQADDTYARRKGEDPEYPLLGLPVAAKEKHSIRGKTWSQGMRAYASYTAKQSHPLVERIRAAGGIIHGRTTSPEFSCATVTHSQLWGVTRNPWDKTKSPGGSSGGSGAALAAGFAPLATASDIAGSTRLPAAFTGTVGYKGPYGTVPGMGPFAADWYRGDGAMGRTVGDTALLANVLRGMHRADHGSVPSPVVSLRHQEDPDKVLQGKRLVYAPTLGNYPVQRAVREQVDSAVEELSRAGASVELGELPWTTAHIRAVTMAHFGHVLAEGMSGLLAGYEETAEKYTLRFIEVAKNYAARMSLFETLEAEHKLQVELMEVLGGADALISPVSAVKALEADGQYLDGIVVDDQVDCENVSLEHYWEAHMTVPFNIANRCPVLAVPAGLSGGFPVGMQIVGKPFDEKSVFDIGAAWEQIRTHSSP